MASPDRIRSEDRPAGVADIARCVWSLATWLLPVPATSWACLRRLDTQVQQQALLDGVLWRVTSATVLGPLVAAMAIVAVLAMQEFAVYEPTGISVVATEMRMVFETGAFSSPDNPITAPLGPASKRRGPHPASPEYASGVNAGTASTAHVRDRRHRVALRRRSRRRCRCLSSSASSRSSRRRARKLTAADTIETGAWPRVARCAGAVALSLAWLIVFVAVGVPIVSLVLSLKRRFDPIVVVERIRPADLRLAPHRRAHRSARDRAARCSRSSDALGATTCSR